MGVVVAEQFGGSVQRGHWACRYHGPDLAGPAARAAGATVLAGLAVADGAGRSAGVHCSTRSAALSRAANVESQPASEPGGDTASSAEGVLARCTID